MTKQQKFVVHHGGGGKVGKPNIETTLRLHVDSHGLHEIKAKSES